MRLSASKIIGLVFVCLIVGMALDFFSITPIGFWTGAWASVKGLARWVWGSIDAVLLYILIGAAVVVPIYLVMLLLRRSG